MGCKHACSVHCVGGGNGAGMLVKLVVVIFGEGVNIVLLVVVLMVVLVVIMVLLVMFLVVG